MCGGLSSLGRGSIQPPALQRIRSAQPCGAPGEPGCGLTCSTLPSITAASASQPARMPCLPTPFGVSASCALLGAGLGSAGSKAQMDHWWGLLPGSLMRAGREGERGRCVYIPCVAPPSPLATEAKTDAHNIDFGERVGRRIRQPKRGQGIEGKSNVMLENVFRWKICSIEKLKEDFCRDQLCTKASRLYTFLCIRFSMLTSRLNSAREANSRKNIFSQCSLGSFQQSLHSHKSLFGNTWHHTWNKHNARCPGLPLLQSQVV